MWSKEKKKIIKEGKGGEYGIGKERKKKEAAAQWKISWNKNLESD